MITADEFFRREFELASEPAAWSLSAFGLKRAAEVLWAAREVLWGAGEVDAALDGAYMLLTGYALENVVKALLLVRRPELRRPGRAPRWPGGGHDLTKLFGEAGVVVSPDERQMLDRLRAFVVWRGRYPMPTKPHVLKAERALSWVTSPVPVVASPDDHGIAVGLFDRVMSQLPF